MGTPILPPYAHLCERLKQDFKKKIVSYQKIEAEIPEILGNSSEIVDSETGQFYNSTNSRTTTSDKTKKILI